jgi:uncharacterized RDD family membrane protein YckC
MTNSLPLPPVPREARLYRGQRAGLVTRLAAGVLDVLVILLLLALIYLAVNAVAFLLHPRTFHLITGAQPVLLTATGITAVAYLAGAWWVAGRTYGYHVMGLRIVDRRGRPPHALVAVARATLYVTFPVGLLACALTSSRRSLQDLLLGTYVVYD